MLQKKALNLLVKRLLAPIAFVVFIAALVEAFFFAYLHITSDNHKRLVAFPLEQRIAALRADDLGRFVNGSGAWVPDSRLGWTHRPGGVTSFASWTIHIAEDGSRTTPDIGLPRIAVFGDSFAEGSEVDDDQTWVAALQNETGEKVAARGVSGYGPDQAALAAVGYLGTENGTHVNRVILTVTLENIGRLLTTYRPFYTYPATDWQFGLKPRFLSSNRVWFPPVNQWKSISEVQDGIRAAAKVDGYLPQRILKKEFPFTWAAIPVLHEHGLLVDLPDAWLTDAGQEAFASVLDYLAEQVPASVAVLVVLLPASRGEWHKPPAADWMPSMVNDRGFAFLDSRTSTAGTVPDPMFREVHYSPKGNQIIATIITEYLQ